MDTETLVKSNVKLVELALNSEHKKVQLEVGSAAEDWEDRFIIYVRPLEKFDSAIEIIDVITDKLYFLLDISVRKYISHIQIFDEQHIESVHAKAVRQMFRERVA
jgi:hypothetical protein